MACSRTQPGAVWLQTQEINLMSAAILLDHMLQYKKTNVCINCDQN